MTIIFRLEKYKEILMIGALIFVLQLLIPTGVYMGGDWTLPQSSSQIDIFSAFNAWNSKANFGVPSIETISSFHYRIIYKLFDIIGISYLYYAKLLIILVTTLSAIYIYKFLFLINYNKNYNLLLTLMYILSPIAFNILTMGWLNAYICYSLIPIYIYYIYKFDKKNINKNIIIQTLLIWVMGIQIQSILWLFVLTVIVMILKKELKIFYLRKYFTAFIYYLVFSASWIVVYLVSNYGSRKFNINAIVNIPESISADSQFNLINAVIGWGSLYNNSYENSISYNIPYIAQGLLLVPFILVLLNINKLNKIYQFKVIVFSAIFWILMLYVVMEARNIFSILPGFAIFRQVSRNIIPYYFLYVSTLAYLYLNIESKVYRIIIFIATLTSVLMSSVPWVMNLNNPAPNTFSLAFITNHYPTSYFDVENILQEKKELRALFLPTGVMQRFYNDDRYVGNYKSFIDTHAAFSVGNGSISVGGGRFNPSEVVVNKYIGDVFPSGDYFNEDRLIDIYIIRKAMIPGYSISFGDYFSNKVFINLFDNDDISVYERIKKNFILRGNDGKTISYQRLSSYKFSLFEIKDISDIYMAESYSPYWALCENDNNNILILIKNILMNKCTYSKYGSNIYDFGNHFYIKEIFNKNSNYIIIYILQYLLCAGYIISIIVIIFYHIRYKDYIKNHYG